MNDVVQIEYQITLSKIQFTPKQFRAAKELEAYIGYKIFDTLRRSDHWNLYIC